MRITSVAGTDLFGGSAQHPLQIVRVSVLDDRPPQAAAPMAVTVRVEGPGVSTPVPVRLDLAQPGAEPVAEVGVDIAAPAVPGSPRQVTAIAEGEGGRAGQAATIRVAESGWTMWMVSHFHYDPVWWDTQGEFTESRLLLPDEDGSLPEVRTAFELVALHLDEARRDPDYKFVLAEIDYLKPYLDTHPEDRADLRRFLAEGRVEIVGGSYNEPNTNLTSAESTIRNAVYGLAYQRDVAGGDPRTAWMLDAFGHDPGYPGLMAAAGLTESSWARGPYHQWGPQRTVGDNTRMQMRSEFEWVSPDGQGLLTSYMPNHYGAGWGTHRAADLAAAEQDALSQFAALAPVAATRNVLLPVGADHVIPSRWVTAIHRDWNARYVWPRFVTALPREFFAAVRADAGQRRVWLVPQTRDMNPVYPGKDVSYIDTKQGQRAAEIAVGEGERLATLAWLAGAGYPAESLDKAWRQLVFGAHHDAITGTESDQVYLDLLGGWREAWQRGDEARRDAASYLAGLADTRPPGNQAGARALTVFNSLSWPRSGVVRAALEFTAPGPASITVRDDSGGEVPFLAEGARQHPDGTLAAVTLTFRAAGVPALGYRTYWATPAAGMAPAPGTGPAPGGWEPLPGTVIENETFLVEADPARGGTLTRIMDKRTGAGLLRAGGEPGHPGGNELLLQEEYDSHPRWGEGPWLLSPKGPGTGSGGASAKVTAQRCPLGARLLAELTLGELRVTQETLLWDGAERIEFRTHVDGSIGQDRLLRVRFPADVPGGLPVYQSATAVVGRSFGSASADVAEHSFTLDNPAHEWFGLGSTARVSWPGPGGGRQEAALGVAEVILPASPPRQDASFFSNGWRVAIRDLVAGLAGQGVTATCSWPDGPRYGSLDLDSNLPDVRIALGGPEQNPWTARLLAAAGPGAEDELRRLLAEGSSARLWIPAAQSRAAAFAPGADVRGLRDLPVLIVAGPDLAAAATAVTADLADSVVEVTRLAPDPDEASTDETSTGDAALAPRSVALLNRGTPGSLVSPDGTLHIALMRACSAWPSGVWIDGDKRTAPDGSSFAWQHWSHTFEYALAAGPGDWREAGFAASGQDYNHDLLACETGLHPGPLPAAASLASAELPVMVSALKPRGNPLAAGRAGPPRRADGVTARLRDLGSRGPAAARLSLFTGIIAAEGLSLVEDGPVVDGAAPARAVAGGAVPGGTGAGGTALPVRAGQAVVAVAPAGTVTLGLSVPAGVAGAGSGPAPAPDPAPAAPPEPAQPVYTRYWMHGKGPAPAGNLPVAVHLSARRVMLPGTAGVPGNAAVRLTVACGPQPAAGAVELDVPPGLEATPGGPLRYDLPALGHAHWDLAVRGAAGAAPGHYFLAARIRDQLGQVLEDATAVMLGGPPLPDLGLPLDALLPALRADQQAIAAEVQVTVLTPEIRVRPGGAGELAVRVANRAASPVRGEAQLISPYGSWPALHPWTRGFSVSPGKEVTLRYHVGVPITTRRGTRWWTMVKLMYFGRLHYTSSVPVLICE
ncbi:MAG: glycoside hydrolase [Streptosporangiaceae bacterium]